MVKTYRDENSVQRIFEDVLKTLKPGETMYITGISEKRYLYFSKLKLLDFIAKLKKRGNKQKLLSCEGDFTRLEGDHLEYRWLPKEFFNPTPMYVYGDKVAILIWGPPQQSVILSNSLLADAYRKQFLFMWENAMEVPE